MVLRFLYCLFFLFFPSNVAYCSSAYALKNIYADISGFGINQEEAQSIVQQGGAPTYGEITYESLSILLKFLDLKSHDVFYDLGSGVGKVTMQVFLDTPVKKSVGIELSPTRFSLAKKAQDRLEKPSFLSKAKAKLQDWGFVATPHKKLEFINQNIVDADIKDATVIFMCSTCFSEQLIKDLTYKFSALKKGLRVVTLKKLAPHDKFILKKTFSLPMTWSTGSQVYIYELVK